MEELSHEGSWVCVSPQDLLAWPWGQLLTGPSLQVRARWKTEPCSDPAEQPQCSQDALSLFLSPSQLLVSASLESNLYLNPGGSRKRPNSESSEQKHK